MLATERSIMKLSTLQSVALHLEYEPENGMLYILKNNIRHKLLVPDELHSAHTTIYGTRIKIKYNRLVWFVLYHEVLQDSETILHRDLDDSNYRRNNLTKISKDIHLGIVEAMKNLSGALKITQHPKDTFACVLEYKQDGRMKKETFQDPTTAKKKLLRMQLRYIKFLGKYIITD